jgi:hypothetical protein
MTGIAALCLAAVTCAWLLDHLRPRHAHFESRRGTLASAQVTVDPRELDGFVSESARIASDTGLVVSLRVLRPDRSDAPRPLIVLLAGRRTGSDAVGLVGHPGSVAIAALDYPYDGPEKLRGVRQTVDALPAIQMALLDTPPAVSLALDWLIAQPWVDPERVELVGASLGAPFAAVAGALDPRFRRVWLIHGGADNQAWLAGALRNKIENPTLREAAAGTIVLLAHGASFDTRMWVARISPRPVVVIGARDDESLSRENIEDLYNAAGEPKTLIWSDGGHVTRHRTDVVRQLLSIVRENM